MLSHPARRSRGVDGGVHGELPSLCEPTNACPPCLRRTACKRFKVELLRPCLNDYKENINLLIKCF